jgi:hypothetical protein
VRFKYLNYHRILKFVSLDLTRMDSQVAQERQENTQIKEQVKRPNKPAPRKQGLDRRIKVRDAVFKEQMHRKLEGKEVPKTLRVSANIELSKFMQGTVTLLFVGTEEERRDAGEPPCSWALPLPCDWVSVLLHPAKRFAARGHDGRDVSDVLLAASPASQHEPEQQQRIQT